MANSVVVVMLARRLGKSYAASLHRAITKTPTVVPRAPVTTPRNALRELNVDWSRFADTTAISRHWVDNASNPQVESISAEDFWQKGNK